MSLLDRVKDLCETRGETFASLERKLDFGNGTLRKWGQTMPSTDRLAKVADYFCVTTDYLLDREKNSEISELEGTYFRLAKGAKDLNLTDDDVDAILNLYKKHQEKNK